MKNCYKNIFYSVLFSRRLVVLWQKYILVQEISVRTVVELWIFRKLQSIIYESSLLLKPNLNSIGATWWVEVSALQKVSTKKHLRKVCVCFIEFEGQYLTFVESSNYLLYILVVHLLAIPPNLTMLMATLWWTSTYISHHKFVWDWLSFYKDKYIGMSFLFWWWTYTHVFR